MRRIALALTATAALALPAGASAAFPGTNGDIAFGRFVGEGGGRILTLAPSALAEAELTPSGRICRHPSYSGDGERIAFSCVTGTMPLRSEIFTTGADGQDEVQVTRSNLESLDPSFSPDGRTIAFGRFEAGDAGIVAIAADGQDELTISDTAQSEFAPAYSPGGTEIVFVRNDGGDNEIWVMNADGSGQVQLTDNAVFDGAPSYSPDGGKIVFTRRDGSDNDLYAMNADGSNQAPLTDTPGSETTPAYSPDGRQLVYSYFDPGPGTTRLWLADANGQNATELTTAPVTEADLQPNWQPLNAPECSLTGSATQKSAKQVVLSVQCDEDAVVDASGLLTAPKPKKRVAASKKKTVSLTPVKVEVVPGAATTLTLTPATKQGRKVLKRALKAGKKAKGTVDITATDDLGLTARNNFAVKLKTKRKKKTESRVGERRPGGRA